MDHWGRMEMRLGLKGEMDSNTYHFDGLSIICSTGLGIKAVPGSHMRHFTNMYIHTQDWMVKKLL